MKGLLALLALLLAVQPALAGHGAAVDLALSFGERSTNQGTVRVSYDAHATTTTTALATTVQASGCTASAVTATEAAGHESGFFTLTVGKKACSFTVLVAATDGADTATYQESGTVTPGSSGAVLEYWIPVLLVFAVMLAGIFWGNVFTMFCGLFGLFAVHSDAMPIGVVGVVFLAALSIFAPGLWQVMLNFRKSESVKV